MQISPDAIDDVRDDVLTPEQFAAAVFQFTDTQIHNLELAHLPSEQVRKFASHATKQALIAEQIAAQYTWGELRESLLPDLYVELQTHVFPSPETSNDSPAASPLSA